MKSLIWGSDNSSRPRWRVYRADGRQQCKSASFHDTTHTDLLVFPRLGNSSDRGIRSISHIKQEISPKVLNTDIPRLLRYVYSPCLLSVRHYAVLDSTCIP